ncbi:MAG: DNA cytosine methyltransferase, partial [Oscillospiraceae bacterium]|nr:DNA cytosine methyltransferase [Oscillospiraceae bacterium]
GSALVDKHIRGLAWIVLRWAATVRPRVIMLENVEEFQTWGPVRKGKPVKKKACKTFQQWKWQLMNLGYEIEHRELMAADYGAPTSRKRFVLVARCDGRPIVWPERTHAPADHPDVIAGKLLPWRSAAEIIDWTQPMYSIFATKQELKERYGVNAVRPLADNTMRRTIRGVDKFTIKSGKPFLVPTGCGDMSAANVIQYHTEQTEAARVNGLTEPMPTVDASNRYAVVTAHLNEYYGNGQPIAITKPMRTVTSHDREALTAVHLDKYFGGGYSGCGNSADEPITTITSEPRHSICAAHIVEFKGQDKGQSAADPLRTITASAGEFGVCSVKIERYAHGEELGYWPAIRELLNKYCGYTLAEDEILLLNIGGVWYFISDIGLRMLTPRELYNAMGFPPDYIIDFVDPKTGKEYSKSAKVARCGNAVCPPMAEAVVRANLPEWCGGKIETMEQLRKVVAV